MSLQTVYPFNTPANYTYDSDKIEITGGKAKLKLQHAELPFTEDFADDTGFIYNSDLAEFIGGQVQQKSIIEAICGANFNTDINLEDWSGGVVTGTAYNGAGITSGKLDLSGSVNKYIDFDALNNADMQQTGCIRFKWTPKYSGAGSFQYLFTIVQAAGNANNRIRMYHQSTLLFYVISDSVGGSIVSVAETFSPVADTEYEIELNFDITTGATRLFVDGVQLGSTQTGTGTRSSNIGLLRLGKDLNGNGNADFLIDDLIIFDSVQHTSNYTKGYSVPDYKYSETNIILPEMEHVGDGSILDFISFATTESGSPRYLLQIGRSGDYLYWDGAAWSVSDESYNQANDETTFDTNCTSLDVDGEKYGQFMLIFPDSNIQSSVSELTATLNVNNGYPTDNPIIEPGSSQLLDALDNFVVVKTITGSDLIKYVLKKGSSYYYHDGSSWVVSDGTYAQSNTEAEIVTNKATFTTSGINFKWVAFLHSDDGSTYPEIDTITVDYSFFEQPESIRTCVVWGYNYNPDGTPSTETFEIRLNTDGIKYKSESVVRYESLTVTPDSNGYWEQDLIETVNMPDTVYYRFIFSDRIAEIEKDVPDQDSSNIWDLPDAA